jgi:hypothetical protein
MKKKETFYQHRYRMSPILLEVLDVEDVTGSVECYKVRWYILGQKNISTSVFPMGAIDGSFAEFTPIPRKVFLKSVEILKDACKNLDDTKNDDAERSYRNAKRRVIRFVEKEVEKYLQ